MSKLFILLIIVSGFESCSNKVSKVPFLAIRNDSINIGNIKEGQEASVKFSVYNTGGDLLVIKSIGVDCGCTKVEVADSTINAGDSTVILMRYSSKTSGDSGRFRKSIVIRSNAVKEYEVIKLYGSVL